MMRWDFMVTGLAVLGIAMPAAAQEHPPIRPTRDVTVSYHEVGGAADHAMTMYFSAAGRRLRIEPAGKPMAMIADRDAHKNFVVMNEQHAYLEMPYDPKRAEAFEHPEGTLTRVGTDTVAGLACTVYNAHGTHGDARICLTSDGVMLRATGADGPQSQRSLEAVKVTYGALPDSLFQPPAGFQKMDMGHMPMRGGAGMPPGMPGGAPPAH